MKQLAAMGISALLLAACQRSHALVAAAHHTLVASVPPAVVNLATAKDNDASPPLPADVDPNNPYAVFAAKAAAAKAVESKGVKIAYRVLGDPLAEPLDWEEHDPDFFSQTTQQKLDLFRRNEQPSDGPMDWTHVEALSALQRALYYAVLNDAPTLITDQDRKELKSDDEELIFHACADRGDAGTLFELPVKDCPLSLRHLNHR